MYSLLIGISIFASILLVLLVLAQNSKGGGLSSQFGGSGASNIMGVKKTGDLLERLTWIFITVVFVVALSTNLISPSGTESDNILERVPNQTAPAPTLPKVAKPDSAK